MLVGLIIIIQSSRTETKSLLERLERDQAEIKTQLYRIQKKLTESQDSISTSKQGSVDIVEEKIKVSEPEIEAIEQKPDAEKPIIIEMPIEENEILKETPVSSYSEIPETEEEKRITPLYSGQLGEKEQVKEEEKIPSAPLPNQPKKAEIDYEKYIGENLVSKIGIAILVLAIGFFVKYAIDNDWIGPVGRVCIGLLSGGILIGLAHRLRKDYIAFTSVLVGGGLAIFYFTIALAYHQYHLFDQTTSFCIMVVITIFSVVLSLLYDRQELAVISMVGGYATPFMVSNGSGNYITLLSYLCILNTGLLIIAYMRIWRVLNVLAFIFTFVIFDSWLFTLDTPVPASMYSNALIFATVFFIFFFLAAIANNIKENKKFLPIDFSILLANSVQYFGIGLYILSEMKCPEYRGLYSASMATFHLVVSYFLFRRQTADKNILYLLIGITLTFISITAPLQLDGNFITLFWASESVVLLWLYQRSRIRIISLGSTLVWGITLVSLVLVFAHHYGIIYNPVRLEIIINKAFISAIYVGMCTGVLYYLSGRDMGISQEERRANFMIPQIVFLIATILIFFISGELEITYQFDRRFDISLSAIYFILYLLFFVITILYVIGRFELLKLSHIVQAVIATVLVGIYMIHLPTLFDTYHDMLSQHKYIAYFSAHWLSALIVVGLIYRLISQLRQSESIQKAQTPLTWAIGALVIIFLSSEFYFAVFGIYYTGPQSEVSIDNVFLKACLPILWGLCSFGFMWVGMRMSFRPLRVLSLVLFTITLLKLFIYDISNVPVAGKIAAFFCLGVILLVVSFMYQRLKKLIIQDAKQKQE
jgi:uncharacterized membrane protein